MPNNTCRTCRYWDRLSPTSKLGDCRWGGYFTSYRTGGGAFIDCGDERRAGDTCEHWNEPPTDAGNVRVVEREKPNAG